MTTLAPYDAGAASFDRHRALPDGMPAAIRAEVLRAIVSSPRPRLLDLGAGTGRIGWPFVAAGDDYVGVDLSFGMLREFTRRAAKDGRVPPLVQANGERLPFLDAAFDSVMLIQVIGAARSWRMLVAEARRVLRRAGALVVGHAVAPVDGIHAKMKRRLAAFLDEMGVASYHLNTRGVVQPWLESVARESTRIVAARWSAERTPREFLDRQRTGARFSALPAPIKDDALRKLGAWAAATFGSLDATFTEQHSFELQVFRFQPEADRPHAGENR